MGEFLVEFYVSRSDIDAVGRGAQRARQVAEELTSRGSSVRYLRSIFLVEDETCFFLYEAASPALVRLAAQDAELPIDRVTAVLTAPSEPSNAVAKGTTAWAGPGGIESPLMPPEGTTTRRRFGMTDTIAAVEADRALKTKHRAMWALGDYPAVAHDLISELGPTLVEACGVREGDRVLDIAAGSGNAAVPAALAGARVVASDLTPELFETGRTQAAQSGVELEWVQGDAEALPFADDEFDTVLSCVGIMFAPHHQASADELLRVCRPGGTIGLLSWTPEGFIGQMFATMKPYAPPPPPGAQPPPLWGSEDHVRGLLRDRVTDLAARRATVTVDRFDTPTEWLDYFKANYGPTIAIYRSLADNPERTAALDRDLTDLAQRYDQGAGTTVLEWEYLLLTARRRSP